MFNSFVPFSHKIIHIKIISFMSEETTTCFLWCLAHKKLSIKQQLDQWVNEWTHECTLWMCLWPSSFLPSKYLCLPLCVILELCGLLFIFLRVRELKAFQKENKIYHKWPCLKQPFYDSITPPEDSNTVWSEQYINYITLTCSIKKKCDWRITWLQNRVKW